MWAWLGLALACGVAVFAWSRSVRPGANYYAADVYGMTPKTHRAYAALSAFFALAFAAAVVLSVIPAVPLLAVYTLVAIFYFSSFARGFSDEQ